MVRSQRPPPLTVVSIGVIGLLLAAAMAPIAAAAPSPSPTQPGPDNTVTRIHVYPNGSAQWTITIRTRLATDEQVSEYEAFQARFRNNTSRYLDPFRERMQGVVANADEATGREMHAMNFTASITIQEVPRRWGIVTYQFTWRNFTATEAGTLVVGDVFQGGLFLAANDTLEFTPPAGYEITDVSPEPTSHEDRVVTWGGREDFADRHPRVVLSPIPNQGTTSPETQQGLWSADGDLGFGMVIRGVVLVGLVGAYAYTLWRRQDDFGGWATMHDPERDPTSPTRTATQPPPDQETVGTTAETEILTDAEQVQELLEANDGRMRQAVIADELDWSPSKTSRVIGDLVDEGTVEKLRLGRENLVELADDT